MNLRKKALALAIIIFGVSHFLTASPTVAAENPWKKRALGYSCKLLFRYYPRSANFDLGGVDLGSKFDRESAKAFTERLNKKIEILTNPTTSPRTAAKTFKDLVQEQNLYALYHPNHYSNAALLDLLADHIQNLRLGFTANSDFEKWIYRTIGFRPSTEIRKALEKKLFRALQNPERFQDTLVRDTARRILLRLTMYNSDMTPEMADYFNSLRNFDKRILFLGTSTRPFLTSQKRESILKILFFESDYEQAVKRLPIAKAVFSEGDFDSFNSYFLGKLSTDLSSLYESSMHKKMAGDYFFKEIKSPLIQSLVELVSLRLGVGLTVLDGEPGDSYKEFLERQKQARTVESTLTKPSAAAIVALTQYIVSNPIINTPEFKADFLKMKEIFRTHPTSQKALRFLRKGFPTVAGVLDRKYSEQFPNDAENIEEQIANSRFSFREFVR